MKPGFQQSDIAVISSNGRDDTLLDALHYLAQDGTMYRVPAGSTTDGMSTPGVVHIMPGYDATGRHWFSAVLHDAAYRGTLERYDRYRYVHAKLTRRQADDLIREALETQGIGIVRRTIIHTALRLFGWPNFKP